MNKIEALKPCPFCGNDGNGPIEYALHIVHCEPDWQHEMRHTWSVQCDKCTATMGYSDSEEEAVEAWNTRAYLTASDAEREPVAASDVSELVERLGKFAGTVRINNGSFSDIAHEAATALTDLEAENARLKAEVERLEKADETRAQDISRLTIERDAARDRLAEALKALEPFAAVSDLIDSETEGMSETDELELLFHDYLMASWPVSMFRAARRVREGGKVDG